MTIRTDIAAVLKTTETNVDARLVGLKIAPVCGRCGGSGRYSFNQMDGDRCYGCNGKGHVKPTEGQLGDMLVAAEECATDGRLAAYLDFLEALRVSKNATDKIMAAWKATGISEAYDWTRVCHPPHSPRDDGYVNPKFCQRDADISEINSKMCAAYTRVSKASDKLNSRSETYRADVLALAGIVAEALAAIEAAKAEFDEYMRKAA